MKYLLALFLLFNSLVLLADDIVLINNNKIIGDITEVSDSEIKYIDSKKQERSIARKKVLSIKYQNGLEVPFYDSVVYDDGKIVKGRVLNVTTNYIEFNPAGTIPYIKIEKSKVSKVIYSSDAELLLWDTLYLTDGKILKAKIINENNDNYEIDPMGPVDYEVIDKDVVKRVLYSNNTRNKKIQTLFADKKNDDLVKETQTIEEMPIKKPKLNNLFIVLYPQFGSGFKSNVDKWNDEYSQKTFDYLQSNYSSEFSNYYLTEDNSDYMAVGFSGELRYFFNESNGVEIGLSLVAGPISSYKIKSTNGSDTSYFLGTDSTFTSLDLLYLKKIYFSKLEPSNWYKEWFGGETHSSTYFQFGIGLSYYSCIYEAGIWEDYGEKGPHFDEVDVKYTGQSLAATVQLEFGVEYDLFVWFAGIKGQAGKISKFKESGSSDEMKTSDGTNVETDLNNMFLYFGVGLGF